MLDNEMEKMQKYLYLLHIMRLDKQNQTAEIRRRIKMTLVAVGKHIILRNTTIPINIKTFFLNICILSIQTYRHGNYNFYH